MSAKLAYRVITASSFDDGHGPEELEIRNRIDTASESGGKLKSKGKGWTSARFCSYPQDVVVGLESVSEVSQIQILSHQSKISSKVEIWIGLDLSTECQGHSAATWRSIDWRRLGYLSLDKNERSNWKARELKSVYINATANYVRFSLHESHINAVNLFNQVGIVALTVLGGTAAASDPLGAAQGADQRTLSLPKVEAVAIAGGGVDGVDENTLRKIQELSALKKEAVINEDYDEAKRCKLCIENLQSAAKELSKLETDKKAAVELEDYDMAKQLKLQIERLRAISLNPDGRGNLHGVGHPAPTANGQGPDGRRQHGQYGQRQQGQLGQYGQGQYGHSHSGPATAQNQEMGSRSNSMFGNGADQNGRAQQQEAVPMQQRGGGPPPIAMGSRSQSQSESISPNRGRGPFGGAQQGTAQRAEDRQIRPMNGQYGGGSGGGGGVG